MAKAKPASTLLREMLAEEDRILACPGVYDGYTARIALSVGFDALYMTGAGTSMSRIGMADLGLTSMPEMVENVEMIANLDRGVPLIADADTGYGSPIMVARTVEKYINAGVAAFHLEDQVVNKKCGHLSGKQMVERSEYLARIRAAVMTRKRLGSDVVIIARTDALASLGLDEAIGRLEDAVQNGADVVMLEAITKKEEVQKLAETFKPRGIPMLYGMVQGSKAYKMTVEEAREWGFKIIVYAAMNLLPIYLAADKAMRHLKEHGDFEEYETKLAPHQIFNICGMKELLALDKEAAMSESANGG